MPSDAERDALRERDPERIYLEPPPYSPEGRVWCAVDVWPLEGDGPSGIEYVRADLVRRELDALTEARAWAGCLGDIADREAPDQYARIALAHAAIAIAERLDALNRTIAAAHGLCIQCMERPRLEALRICGTCYRIGVPHGQDAA